MTNETCFIGIPSQVEARRGASPNPMIDLLRSTRSRDSFRSCDLDDVSTAVVLTCDAIPRTVAVIQRKGSMSVSEAKGV